jgi:hypothetical protein
MSQIPSSLQLSYDNERKEDHVRAVHWQRQQAASIEEIGPADIEALIAQADDSGDDIDFDLGEAWNEPFDPTEDDPE